MKPRRWLNAALSVILALGMSPATALADTADEDSATETTTSTVQIEGTAGVDYVDGQVIVAVSGGADALQAAAQQASAQSSGGLTTMATASSFSINESLATVSTEDVAQAAADLDATDEINLNSTSDGSTLSTMSTQEVEVILLDCDDVAQTIAQLQEYECVVAAQPNYIYTLIDSDETTEALAETVSAEAQNSAATADSSTTSADNSALSTQSTSTSGTGEPFFDAQWSLQNETSLQDAGYTNTTSLNVEDAWTAGAGNEENGEVVVAVIDCGVDYTHEELVDRMWDGGEAEWSTALGGGKYGYNSTGNGQRNDPMDILVGHGTHCASTIAAAWNDTGIAGINNQVKIMAVRAIPGNTAATISAYNYVITAKENGVNVVAASNSWGPSSNTGIRDIMLDAMVYRAGEDGVVSVFAAGNAGFDNDLDAGAHLSNANPYLLTVGALNSQSEAVLFSQYGKCSVDVFSPGVQVLAATSSYGEKNGTSIQMNSEYLPWLEDSVSSQSTYFLDDAENITRSDGITYDLVSYDSYYNITEIGSAETYAKGYPCAGVNNNKSYKFNLSDAQDALTAGNSIAIRMTIPAKVWDSYVKQNKGDNLYISVTGAFNDSGFADPWVKTCVRTALGWEELTGAINGNRDHNWYAMATTTSLSGVNNGKGDNGDVTILFNVHGLDKTTLTSDDYLYLDNISMGWACSSNTGTKAADSTYYYSDGTSMATPNVTGVVSLLCSHACAVSEDSSSYQQDAATARQIVSFIKGGVTQLESLSDKCGTGGVANANESYTAFVAYEQATSTEEELAATASLKPVCDSITDNGDGTSTLSGSFFGSTQGTVTFKDTELTVVKWTDSAITFESLTYSKEQIGKVMVTKSNGLTGQDYLILPAGTDSAKSFTTLSNPDFPLSVTFTGADKQVTTVQGNASEVTPLHMAAAGGYLYVYGTLADNLPVLMRYNISSGTWDTENYLDEYASEINVTDNRDNVSLCAGASQIYLKYNDKDGGFPSVMTLDAATGAVIYDVALETSTNANGSLGFLKGKLYLVGGKQGEPACIAIYPDTGKSYWTASKTLEENAYFGNVTCNGSGFTITGSFGTDKADYNGYGAGVRNEQINMFIFADEMFLSTSENVFFPTTETASKSGLDANQSFVAIGAAGADGTVIVTGPVRNNESDNMVDTWLYDARTDVWTAIMTSRFADSAVSTICSCTNDGIYYVMGSDPQQGDVYQRFASFELANWELRDDGVTATANAQAYGDEALIGDVNGNNTINIVDAQLAYDIATTEAFEDRDDYPEMCVRADVTKDGYIDAADSRAIQYYVLRGTFGSAA